MTRAQAAAVALALLCALPAMPPAAGVAIQDLPWWNQTGPTQGFHMRVLVQASNPYPYDVSDAPVAAELDLAKLLSDAGWPHVRTPGQDQLKAFELEPNSIRVVPLNDLDGPPGVRGSSKTVDDRFGPSDPRRYEAPSMHFEGSLAASGSAFDPRSSPRITVVWRVPGTLRAGEARPYMVYFDVAANGARAAPDYNGTVAGEALRSLFWSGPGVTLYGAAAAASSTSVSTVTVAGLQPDTTVTVWAADALGAKAGIFTKVVPPAGQGFPTNPFKIGPDSRAQAYVGSGSSKLLRIDADKPVLGFGLSTGFVPSLDGGAAGTDFVFALTQDALWEQDTVYFLSTSAAPTQVEVQQVEAGAPVGAKLHFDLNNGANPFPYTRGARSAGFTDSGSANPCTPVGGPGTAPLLPLGPGLYHAHVVQGDPVLLQLQSEGGLFPVPSRMGGPSGTAFQAALGWNDKALQSAPTADCVDATNHGLSSFDRKGTILAAGLGGPARVAVTSVEATDQIFPPGSPQDRSPPPQAIGAAPALGGPYLASAVLDRPVQVTANAPIQLYAGQAAVNGLGGPSVGAVPFQGLGAPNGQPVFGTTSFINGPLWGTEIARRFAGLGPTVAFAPFPDTRVAADLRFDDGSRQARQFTPSPGGALQLDNLQGARLAGYTLASSKPLIVYPVEGTAATLAGIPAFLRADTLGTEFRGYLVGIAAANGQDPLAGSTPPGQDIAYTLKVTNLGRGASGADLTDDVTVRLANVDPAWTARLDGQQVETLRLASGETRDVRLTVRNATALHAGDAGTLLVVATSGGNPRMQDSLAVSTSIKSSFAVGLWFDREFGVTQQAKPTSAGQDATYVAVLRNLGSVTDTFDLALEGVQPGWRARLTTAAGDALEGGLTLAAGESRQLRVTVTPPSGPGQPVQQLAISAISRGSSAAFAVITAVTKVNLPTNVHLDAPGTFAYVAPGGTASFPIAVSNAGDPSKDGAASLNFQLASDAPAGWDKAVLGRIEPATGALQPVPDNEAILPGQPPLLLNAALKVPAGQAAHTRVVLHLTATQRQGGPTLEAFLYLLVAADHELDVPLPPIAAAPAGGGNLTITVALGNHGNLNESLRPLALSLPPGWGLGLPDRVAADREGTASFPATVKVPAGALPGLYNVTLRLVSEDGNATVVPLAVQVGVSGSAASSGSAVVLAAAGATAQAAFPLRNDGNTPLTVTATPLASEPWSLASTPDPFLLAPGASGTLRVSWSVPRGAPDGIAPHRVHVVLAPRDGGASQRDLEASVSVGHADLAVKAARAFAGAAGTLVGATVANLGDREARAVRVELRVGNRALDNVTLERLPAGTSANVTLLLPRGTSGEARIVLDPADTIAERDEANNVAAVGAASSNGSPAPGAILLVLLVALAAARRRA